MSSHVEFDLSIPPFPAPIRKWYATSGIIPYGFKCLSVGPLLYVLGALVTFATNTFNEYIADYAFLLGCVVASVALYGIVHGCKQVSRTIDQLDETVEHSKDPKFKRFIIEITNEGYWFHIRDRYWCYLHMYGLAVLIAAIAYLGFIGPPWVINGSRDIRCINHVYFFGVWGTVMGYVLGLGFELTWCYARNINMYCNEFVKAEKTKLFPLEEVGGLKPLGNLALKINIAAVTPIVYILVCLYKEWVEKGTTLTSKPLSLFMLIVYATMLTLIFFYPIRPAHEALVNAKAKERKHLSCMIKQTFDRGNLDNLENYNALNNLLLTHQNLKKVSTWPLDLRLSIGSAATIFLPLVGGAILQIWFEFLFRLFV